MHNFWRLTSIVLIVSYFISPLKAREQLRIVGSTAVYPFSTAVAERIGKTTDFKTPIVEATGTGGGIKIFCGGKTDNYPDIVNTSRPMTDEEIKLCRHNGVNDVIELKIGYDGIVLGTNTSQEPFKITKIDLSKALAEVTEKNGEWIENPHHYWSDINPSLPNEPIIVLGPTSTLASREVFENQVIQQGCMAYATDKKSCRKNIREDGRFIEVAEHENVIIQKINLHPKSIGFVSYGFYYQNPDKIKAIPLDGILPTTENIINGSYPLARPLYLYIKKSRLDAMPSLRAFLTELISEQASGSDGYLVDIGLIPSPYIQLHAAKFLGEYKTKAEG